LLREDWKIDARTPTILKMVEKEGLKRVYFLAREENDLDREKGIKNTIEYIEKKNREIGRIGGFFQGISNAVISMKEKWIKPKKKILMVNIPFSTSD